MTSNTISRRAHVLFLLSLLAVTVSSLWADSDQFASLRNSDIETEAEPPRFTVTENKDIKRIRSYSMQPSTIPHKIDGDVVDPNANKCLSCHNRTLTEQSQAPMVSVTHYMNRDGNFLAQVSPRRYFCNQCHVVQVDTAPLIDNDFKDVNSLLINRK